MKNTFSDIFTQGGQTQLHKFHMMRQVVGTTLKIGLWIWLIAFAVLVYMTYVWQDFWLALCYGKAYVRLVYFKMLPNEFWDSCWLTIRKTGQWKEFSDLYLIRDAKVAQFITAFLPGLMTKLFQALGIALLGVVALVTYWHKKGRKKNTSKIIGGSEVVSDNKLRKAIFKKKMASSIQLASVPLLADKEKEHFMFVGATGSGKTNALIELMTQIRSRGDRAVIVDTTGELLQRMFVEGDKILNPLDRRSQNWDLWQEFDEDYQLQNFAECLIPPSHHEPFWNNAARALFLSTVAILQKKPSYQEMVDISTRMDIKQAEAKYRGTLAASFMNKSSERTASSVRSILVEYINAFSYLESEWRDFSIRSWINDSEKDWLFLSCLPEQRALLRPIISSWFALACRSIMIPSQKNSRRTWFIMDELPSLHRLSDLPQILAEIRKYGGCVVLGLQNIAQLDSLYGKDISQTINSLTGTKVIFRCGDVETAKRASQFLGEQIVIESSESISYGAHPMRDGVSMNESQQIKMAVSYTDLSRLNNLEAYIKLPGDFPIAKLTFNYHPHHVITQSFMPRYTSQSMIIDHPMTEIKNREPIKQNNGSSLPEQHNNGNKITLTKIISEQEESFIDLESQEQNLGDFPQKHSHSQPLHSTDQNFGLITKDAEQAKEM